MRDASQNIRRGGISFHASLFRVAVQSAARINEVKSSGVVISTSALHAKTAIKFIIIVLYDGSTWA